MKITFACTHTTTIGDGSVTAPLCWCGESRIQAVQSRAPRFVGACSGPYAETRSVEPATVNLARTPLVLKEQE